MVEPEIFDENVEDIDGNRSKKRKRKRSGGSQAKRARVTQSRDDSVSASQDRRMSGESQGASSTSHSTSQSTRMSGESQETQGAVDDDDDEDDDAEATVEPATESLDFGERWTTYFEWSDRTEGLIGSKNSPGLDPALRDLVRGIPCRRTSWKVYYAKNKELGKSSASLRR